MDQTTGMFVQSVVGAVVLAEDGRILLVDGTVPDVDDYATVSVVVTGEGYCRFAD